MLFSFTRSHQQHKALMLAFRLLLQLTGSSGWLRGPSQCAGWVCPWALQWACSVFSSESTASGQGEKYDSTVTLGWYPCAPLLSLPHFFSPSSLVLSGSISHTRSIWMCHRGVFLFVCSADERRFSVCACVRAKGRREGERDEKHVWNGGKWR